MKKDLVLVVDDNPNILKLVQVNLEFEGYETLLAADGKEALEKIRKTKPDLIILDILMPRMDGWQVLEALKKDYTTASIPVIVLTAVGTNEDRRRGLELGVTDYLTKPFNAIRLLETVKRTLHPITSPSIEKTPELLPVTRVAIAGGSEDDIEIFQTLLGNSHVEIVGISIKNSAGPIAKIARELNIPVSQDPYALCSLPNIDLLIETKPGYLNFERALQINPSIEIVRGKSASFTWGLLKEKDASEVRTRALVKELHTKVKELNALYEAGKTMSSVIDLESIVSYVMNCMGNLGNAESGALYIEENGKLSARAVRGKPPKIKNLPEIKNTAFRKGAPVVIKELSPTSEVSHKVFIPLGIKEKNIGFVALSFLEKTDFSEGELTFLATLAAEATIAIENARLYEKAKESKRQVEGLLSKVIDAQEEERKRIAAEIHDSIAQTLVSALTRVQTCQAVLQRSTAEGQEELEKLKTLIIESVGEVRQIIFNLRPSTLDDLGLIPTLENYLKRFEKENHITASLEVTLSNGKLPAMVETAIYRIVQEALTNVKKHSGATEVEIFLKKNNGKLFLSVSDNGKGIEPDKVQNKSTDSVGIIGIRERVNLLGGKFAISTSVGHGTSVSVEIPVS